MSFESFEKKSPKFTPEKHKSWMESNFVKIVRPYTLVGLGIGILTSIMSAPITIPIIAGGVAAGTCFMLNSFSDKKEEVV